MPVKVLSWHDKKLKDFRKLSHQAYEIYHQPLVFRGVPLHGWSAWKQVSRSPQEILEDIIDEGRRYVRPKVAEVSFFQYFSSPLQEMWHKKWNLIPPLATFAWDKMMSDDELRDLLTGDSHLFGYWIMSSSDVSSIGGPLNRSTPTLKTLFGSPMLGKISNVTGEPHSTLSAHLWLASPGLSNNAHYDAHWNYLVHVSGPKRIFMAPPKDAWNLHIYPRFHPGLRSSPIDLRRPWDDVIAEFPSAGNARIMEVDLLPGDILLIPPFWIHATDIMKGSEPSLTYSFFSDCAESAAARARIGKATWEMTEEMIVRFLRMFKPATNAAYDFLKYTVLQKSLRASPEREQMFCRVDRTTGELEEPLDGCPGRVELSRDHIGAMGHVAKLFSSIEDPAVAMLLVQGFAEEIAMMAWSPLEICAGLELCVLPRLMDT